MPSEDRCRHGMIRTQCHICQAPPEYEMKEDIYKGNPIVELFHNGGPIHERDAHFRFGEKKAKLFLACMDIVKELAATQGDEMPDIKNQKVIDAVSGDTISVELKREIDLSNNRRLKIPWVHLQSGKYSNLDIGFGRRKAKAIVALRRQLAAWANYPLVDR